MKSESYELNTLQDSRAIGAIAGLAVAIVFTWRILRTPSSPQRRQPKRQAPASSSSGVGRQESIDALSSGVGNPSEDLKTQNVVDEFFQNVKVDLFFCFFIRHMLAVNFY